MISDRFTRGVESLKGLNKRMKELIVLKIKNFSSGSERHEVEMTFNSLKSGVNQTFYELEMYNRGCLSDKSLSNDEIAERVRLLDEMKYSFKKIIDYYERELKSEKIESGFKQASEDDDIRINIKGNTQELEQKLEQEKKKQDVMVDEFSALVKKIHSANREIESELKNQNVVINKLESRVDSTKGRVESTSSKLDAYLQKSSNCCLFSFIAIEVFITVLLIVA